MIGLQLHTTHYVSCPACGYRRTLTPSQAEDFIKGEHFYGSKKCPACSMNGSGSVAQASGWVSEPGECLR